MERALGGIAIVVGGLMVGNELAVATVHRILRGQADSVHVEVASALAAFYGRWMPYWYAATLVLTIAVAWSFRGSDASWWFVGSAIAFAATIVLAALVLARINKRVAAWDPSALPSDWRVQRQRWDRLHALRLAMLIVGFVALTVGVLLH